MALLELLICEYYKHSECLLRVCSFITWIGIAICFWFLKGRRRCSLKEVFGKIFLGVTLISVGVIFRIANLTPEIEYIHFNVMIFILLVGIVILYETVQGLLFKKIKLPILHACKSVEYIIFFEMFWLTITNHLELWECVAGLSTIFCMESFWICMEKVERKKKREEDKISNKLGYPNPDLFYTRKKQLESFVLVLEEQKKEPYAVMISGEWGAGKSSFVKALEKRLDQDVFIWVYAGSEKNVSEIMLEISANIVKILRENNILVENGGLIEKYFLAFSGLLEEVNLKFFNQVIKIFQRKEEDSREYLNRKLTELDKTIYLIVDDLDRCSNDYQEKMFKVIRESTNLNHCKAIFLVNKSQFNVGEEHYIEKYISYTLELCKVESDEIVGHFIDDIVEDEFIVGIDAVFLKGRGVREIKKIICDFPKDILACLETEISKCSDEMKKKSVDEKEQKKNEMKIADLEKSRNQIENNITNARKIKNYLNGVRRDMERLNSGIAACSGEFQNEDWLDVVIRVEFLKCIFPKLYTDIKMYRDLNRFGQDYKGYTVEILLKLKYGFTFSEEKWNKMLNYLIYEIDVIDFAKVQSEREQYLEELHKRPVIANVKKYLEYADGFEDWKFVIDMCEEQEFKSHEQREDFIGRILRKIYRGNSLVEMKNQELFELSRKLLTYIGTLDLSEREKLICRNEKISIIGRMMRDNKKMLQCILILLFPLGEVKKVWLMGNDLTINEFYGILKRLDKDGKYEGLEGETNKLSSIRRYYASLRKELQKEQYQSCGWDFEEVFREIGIMFDTCEMWENIENYLNPSEKNNHAPIEKYFDLEKLHSFHDVLFTNVSELKAGLQLLGEVYSRNGGWYKSSDVLVLLRVSYRMVELYEGNSEWFGDSLEEICALLECAVKTCRVPVFVESSYEKEIMMQLNTLVYKFRCYSGARILAKNAEDNENSD